MLIRYLYMTKFITVVALVMGLTGCATLPNNPPSSNTLTVEHVDSNAVQISNITVRQEGSGIKVSGNLRNRFNQRRIDRGHLHIEILVTMASNYLRYLASTDRITPIYGSGPLSKHYLYSLRKW